MPTESLATIVAILTAIGSFGVAVAAVIATIFNRRRDKSSAGNDLTTQYAVMHDALRADNADMRAELKRCEERTDRLESQMAGLNTAILDCQQVGTKAAEKYESLEHLYDELMWEMKRLKGVSG